MAETKTKKNTSQTEKKPAQNKKPSAPKKPSAKQKQREEQLRMEAEIKRAEQLKKRNQTMAIVVFAVSLVLTSIVLIPAQAGTAWHAIRGFIFGLFGYSGFIIPVVFIYIAVMMTMEKMEQSSLKKFTEGLLLVFFISALVYVIRYSGSTYNFGKDVLNEYRLYFDKNSIGWGIFGAVIGEALMLLGSSKGPAVAILLVLIFVTFMFLTGFTLIRLMREVKKPVDKVSGTIDKAKQEKLFDTNDDDEFEEEVRKSGKKVKKPFFVYGENALEDEDEEEVSVKKPAAKKEKAEEPEVIPVVPVAEPAASDEADEIKDIFAMAADKANEEPEILKKEDKKVSQAEIEKAQDSVASEIDENDEATDENYILPPLECLRLPARNTRAASQADLKATADKLIDSLNSFNVDAKVIDVVPGPSVTRYEVAPAPGVKISKFTGLADDLALHLAAPAGVRIEAPIPNKSAIGIEVPNRGRTTVTMREIVDSDIYRKSKSRLNVALGKDIAGNVVCADLAKMPHLLIAGTTGSGKSVCLNAMIVSLLYNAKPSEVKILLIDPKQVEFSVYNGIPHLLVPVVSDARKAAGALAWAVTEMLNRYKTLNDNGVRDIGAYNSMCDNDDSLQRMSQIVIVIDELSDLMSVAPSEVEGSITRLAQMARAAGMHLVVATQRPSVDVITGLIKANIPSRIALSVSSQVDSRTIIDSAGAEKLLGLGDMLFYPVGMSKPLRVQGCFLSDEEIENVVSFVKTQEETSYDDEIQQEIEKQALTTAPKKGNKDTSEASAVSDAENEIIMKAAELVISNPDKASISSLQRHLSLGFAKAGRIMDALEERGVVGPHAGSKPRKVMMTKAQWYEMNAMSSEVTSTEVPDNTDSEDDF